MDDLTAMVPNFTLIQGSGDRQPQFSLRGLRDNNLGVGQVQSVVYLDDVPYDDTLTRGVPLYGLDTVEFFRGAQGTRFGVTAPGGVLDLHTQLPGNQRAGAAAVSYGSWQTWQAEASLSGPIVSNVLQLGVSGFYFQREGFVRNTTTGDFGDGRETLAGRAHLRWTPTERIELLLTASGYKFDDGLQPGAPLGQSPYTVSRNFDGYDRQDADTESLRATYRAEAFKVVSITSHTGWREQLWQDSDYSPLDISQTRYHRDLQQWREELRVESSEETAPWHWRAGAFFASKKFDSTLAATINQPPVPTALGTTQRNRDREYAVFGEVTRELGDHFDIGGGVRLDYYSSQADGLQTVEAGGFPVFPPAASSGGDTLRTLQPRGEIGWKPTAQSRAWFAVTRGVQPGGYSFNAAPAPAAYGRSDAWQYELGWSAATADGKWAGRVMGFYSAVHDYQVFRPTGFGNFAMLNAPRAHTAGAELELTAKPDQHWQFTLGGGWVTAKFDEFADPVTSESFKGKTINLVPEGTLDATVSWQPDEHWFVQVSEQVVGRFYFDEANSAGQSAYGLLNFRVGWQDKHWGVAVFGRNVLDQEYAATAFHFNQPPAGNYFLATPGHPATFGAECFVHF